MGTRSRIAVMQEDNSVRSVYCHWDGYPSNNGSILYQCYNSLYQAEALVAIGAMSGLRQTIRECSPYTDKGEELEIETDNNLAELLEQVSRSDQEYLYVWDRKQEEWYFTPRIRDNPARMGEQFKTLREFFQENPDELQVIVPEPEPDLSPEVLAMLNTLDIIIK